MGWWSGKGGNAEGLWIFFFFEITVCQLQIVTEILVKKNLSAYLPF